MDPEKPPLSDLDVVSDERDDLKKPLFKGRDAKGRLVRGHKALPAAGRPVECALKARKTLQNGDAWTVAGEIISGTRIANPGQVEMMKLMLERGYGKAMDMQTHVHLMAGASADEKSGLSILSADALTQLTRLLLSPTTTTTAAPVREDVVEGELVDESE